MEDLLKLTVENTMSAYKSGFEEGRKIGFQEGIKAMCSEINKMTEAEKQEAERIRNERENRG